MKPSQIPQLIAEIALADPRIRRDNHAEQAGQVKMWVGILTDVPYDAALRLAHRHYATNQWPIMPANIATAWHAEVRNRLERHTEPTPAADPDNPQQWTAELRNQRHAVAMGELPPAPYTAAEGTRRPIAAITGRIGREPGYIPDDVRQQLAALLPNRAKRETARAAREATGATDPLSIPCPWCSARAGDQCRHMGAKTKLTPRSAPHPSRVEAAEAASGHRASA